MSDLQSDGDALCKCKLSFGVAMVGEGYCYFHRISLVLHHLRFLQHLKDAHELYILFLSFILLKCLSVWSFSEVGGK